MKDMFDSSSEDSSWSNNGFVIPNELVIDRIAEKNAEDPRIDRITTVNDVVRNCDIPVNLNAYRALQRIAEESRLVFQVILTNRRGSFTIRKWTTQGQKAKNKKAYLDIQAEPVDIFLSSELN